MVSDKDILKLLTEAITLLNKRCDFLEDRCANQHDHIKHLESRLEATQKTIAEAVIAFRDAEIRKRDN